MRRKYKMTGCARFLIFMLFFAPIAYIGASYYKGEDGIQNIKDFLGMDENGVPESIERNDQETIKLQEQEIERLQARIDELEKQLEGNE